MAYTVLARRYRSATFDDVVGQNHVAQTLKKAIASNRIAHAYLFGGTRGVGKTSMARIFAKALNCLSAEGATTEPCLKCESCIAIARGDDIDVIEVDAASNTQVDKTREVILENAQYRPARSRFKIYIIDEVHMLSKASFNALLKTLEEPPEHVKFILATTETEKILPTILSRCQRYDFRNIPTREIAGHLRNIVNDEKIDADDDALLLVAKAGAGSMRDSLSLLDRLLSIGEKRLTIETIEQLLGLPRTQLVYELVRHIGGGNVKDVLVRADRMINEGLSPDGLVAALIDHFRNLLVIRTCGTESNLVEVAGLSPKELSDQANQFSPADLSQNITILEDLRRQLRQSNAGRAILDALLVRLSLAEQFTPISELVSKVDGAPAAAAAQKKKPEPEVAEAPLPPSPVTPGAPNAVPAPRVVEPPPSLDLPEPSAAPSVASSLNDLDLGDDLPSVGKVWEGGSPSLGAIFKKASHPPPKGSSNVEPVRIGALPSLWQQVLALLAKENKFGVSGMLQQGKLAGMDDGQVVVEFPRSCRMAFDHLNANGKRELITDVFSRALGQAIGVRFELSKEDPAVQAAAAPPAPAGPQRPANRPRFEPPSAPPPPRDTGTRPTTEQVAEFEKDPLIGALMRDLGAQPLSIKNNE